ncbi:MAG: hypothetical protein FWG65_06510 [Turicibacter sp.]|nr:hypothetical protein [Turicibacter sp.]
MDITIYLEDGQREEFDKLCEEFGINASQAANIFVNRAITAKTLPFEYEDEDVRRNRERFERLKKIAAPQNKRILTEEEKASLERFGAAMKSMQEKSVLNGNSEMTLDEINAIIADCRREKREEEALMATTKPKIEPLQGQSTLQEISIPILEEVGA